MTKKFLLAIGTISMLGVVSCKQQITEDDVKQVNLSRPKAEEMAKQYNYSKITVPTEQHTQDAMLLLRDDPKNGIFGGTFGIVKVGEEISIKNVTDAKAKLGRVLFYDKKLSLNSTVSCGSCHNQGLGFSDGKAFSTGFEGKTTSRSSMAICNPALSRAGMFWDEREASVTDLALRPVVNHIEMGMEDLKLLQIKLAGVDYYPDLFKQAYGDTKISSDRIAESMAAFLRSMVSWDSKYDQGVKANFANFTKEEKRGMEIFMGKNATNSNQNFQAGECSGCHAAPNFDRTWGGGANIGLDKVSKDKGLGNGMFKVPTLRNVELTAPYMHDGRFKTLEEVVDHYNEKVIDNPSLDWNLKDQNGNGAKKLNLIDADKKALVAFLKTLTDKKFVNDSKFSDPFAK